MHSGRAEAKARRAGIETLGEGATALEELADRCHPARRSSCVVRCSQASARRGAGQGVSPTSAWLCCGAGNEHRIGNQSWPEPARSRSAGLCRSAAKPDRGHEAIAPGRLMKSPFP